MDDQTSVQRVKQGDLGGLESLVARYQARAVQAAYLIVFDPALAEDIVQDAFIRAAERIHQFDETRPFAPWFFRIMINAALKAARRQKKAVPLEDPACEPAGHIARALSDPALLPELQVESGDLRRHVLAAIRSLPPEQRAVITMRYYLDLSEAEMSARLERPLSTIKWWLRAARQKLRSLLDGQR